MNTNFVSILLTLLLYGCGSSTNGNSKEDNSTNETKLASTVDTKSSGGIVGEWQQEFTCYDKNGNAQLEMEERVPAKNTLGFNYFRFNGDGSCLRDKDMKFKGTWEIKETGTKRTLIIQAAGGGDVIKYTIKGETADELVLYQSGVFLVFKRL